MLITTQPREIIKKITLDKLIGIFFGVVFGQTLFRIILLSFTLGLFVEESYRDKMQTEVYLQVISLLFLFILLIYKIYAFRKQRDLFKQLLLISFNSFALSFLFFDGVSFVFIHFKFGMVIKIQVAFIKTVNILFCEFAGYKREE